MTTFRRFLGVVSAPTQYQVFLASSGFTTDLPVGHEVQRWHHGEDGVALELHDLRGPMFIDRDFSWSEMEPWVADAFIAANAGCLFD